jgi:hypothetical protein
MCFTKKHNKLKKNKVYPLNKINKCVSKDINLKTTNIKKEYIPAHPLKNSK